MIAIYSCYTGILWKILPMNEAMWSGLGPPHLALGHMSIDDAMLDLSPVDEAPEVLNLDEIFPDHVNEICEEDGYDICPVEYTFDDYDSGPVGESEIDSYWTSIYGNYDALNLEDSRLNGKEFVRSKTLPTIPVYKYLQPEEICPPPAPDDRRCSSPPSTLPIFQGSPLLGLHPQSDSPSPNPGLAPNLHVRKNSASPAARRRGVERGRLRSYSADRRRRSKQEKSAAWSLDDDENEPDVLTSATTQESRNVPLYYTTPPKANMANMAVEDRRGSLTGSKGLSRLARRLSQKERRTRDTDGLEKRTLRQRSVSLDCGDGRRVSLLTAAYTSCNNDDKTLSTSPSMPSKLANKSGGVSPNAKLIRNTSGKRKGSADVIDGSLLFLSRVEKKKLERKLTGMDSQALFDAVEHQDLDAVKTLLETSNYDINCTNDDGFVPLDIAIMTNNMPLAKLMLKHGAKENTKWFNNQQVLEKLTGLVNNAARRVVDLMATVVNGASGKANISSSQHRDNERLLSFWEFRHRLLKRMKLGYEQATIPDSPTTVTLYVANNSSLLVNFKEPANHNGAIITRYKVEWSCFEDFHPLAGETVINSDEHRYQIPNLTQGNTYYVRVTAGNIKGYGPFAASDPPYAVPSSWREVDNMPPRSDGKLKLLDTLFTNIRNARPADASEIKDTVGESPLHQRKPNVKKSFKNLFTAPKFQKNLKSRGVYIASLLYNEDRVLVAEDTIPIVEVDENFTSTSLHTDFHWMMKVACTWEDVKSLRQDMDKNSSSSTVHFRSKLLQAAAQLQNGLGIQDLGQFHYRMFKDSVGTIMFVIVNHIRDPKSVNTSNTRWTPLTKLQKRLSVPTLTENTNANALDMVMTSLTEIIRYDANSKKPMSPGLYLGYLKLRSSVDLIRVMVPERIPNIVPHVKIRGCPNVSREEWEWVQNLSANDVKEDPSPGQVNFQNLLTNSCKDLLNNLGISEDDAISHRLYDLEVIELSDDVSFLLLLPPVEHVCSVPGHNDELSSKEGFLTPPVQVFEMVHMCTYQRDFINRYSRLSSILEMDLQLAQQAQREAFSTEEVTASKERLEMVTKFQATLDEAWRGMRWTMDIITYGRDKTVRGGLPLGVLYAPPPSPNCSPEMYRKDMEHVTSSASDLGYHSDRNSADYNMDTQNNQSRDRNSACDMDMTDFTGDSTVTSGYCSHNLSDDASLVSNASNTMPGILRVFAAYETGLSKGTSVKLHVTLRTTSREVIDLVVQQLNRATRMRHPSGPFYTDEQLEDFCLVAVIGARERVLRDDYQPLTLQNPWTKGRLYVRMRSDLLAALEQTQVTTV
ncbi:ankyrin repeat and fibronectin type-III domain-containing protein 1-like isoform X3 [Lineus longissimus]|uniref:ankyrin repeat and fibronectin type-III domain-containing protein 1-like isoform X3 n=1 Tax=Lineus longissimus TaxID=88925 RepID=UPI00315C8232